MEGGQEMAMGSWDAIQYMMGHSQCPVTLLTARVILQEQISLCKSEKRLSF